LSSQRIEQFSTCRASSFNQKSKTSILLIKRHVNLTLNSGWITGLTDAEGCFNLLFTTDSEHRDVFRVRLRFIIDQKLEREILLQISALFGSGAVSERGCGTLM